MEMKINALKPGGKDPHEGFPHDSKKPVLAALAVSEIDPANSHKAGIWRRSPACAGYSHDSSAADTSCGR